MCFGLIGQVLELKFFLTRFNRSPWLSGRSSSLKLLKRGQKSLSVINLTDMARSRWVQMVFSLLCTWITLYHIEFVRISLNFPYKKQWDVRLSSAFDKWLPIHMLIFSALYFYVRLCLRFRRFILSPLSFKSLPSDLYTVEPIFNDILNVTTDLQILVFFFLLFEWCDLFLQ